MRVTEAFPSNYLRAADLQDRNARVMMDMVKMEEIAGGEMKPVLYFEGKEKGLVLNKTNATNISMAYGDETDDWQGKELVLYPTMVDFQGRSVPAIRVRAPAAKDRRSAAPPRQASPQRQDGGGQPAKTTTAQDMDDEIPFRNVLLARFLAYKQFGSLRPADEGGEAALRKLGNGELVMIETKQSRNIKHHRMFWALMTLVWQNIDGDRYPTVEDLVAAVKIAAGLRTRIELPSGEVGFIPGSIAFHKLDQDAFSEFYNRVCDLLAKHFLPGVTSDQLREEVEIMIGIKKGPL